MKKITRYRLVKTENRKQIGDYMLQEKTYQESSLPSDDDVKIKIKKPVVITDKGVNKK